MLQEYLDFVRAFRKRPRSVGSIVPSSRSLARQMLHGFDLAAARLVVEIGPGTGAFTGEILSRLTAPERYCGLELNSSFIALLRQKFPGAAFYEESAERVGEVLGRHGGPAKADYVVSGLPWAVFDDELQESILMSLLKVLGDGGQFSTFAYVHALQLPPARRFRKLLLRVFSSVQISRIVWRNVPPAIVYRCTR